MLKIGNEVKFENEVGDIFSGEITEVLSDSYDDVRLRDGEVEYWSKKTKKYVPVKEKHADSVFFEVKTSTGVEYAYAKEFFQGIFCLNKLYVIQNSRDTYSESDM